MTDEDSVALAYLDEVRRNFRGYKRLAEGALAQLKDAEFFYAPDEESLSMALLMKHINGNQRSRFTDFLTTDGEKPDRNRDQEFELEAGVTREQLMQRWEAGWNCVFDALASLKSSDVSRTVYIRGTPHSVIQALQRALAHYAYHVGQVVYLAKHIRKAEWQSLSIPKGESAEYNAVKPEDRKVKSPSAG
ncbi:MAG TPA: DUF1572 family protein [Candidatus Angelobacter sp.]